MKLTSGTFLKGSGATLVLVAGGGIWRTVDQGVIGPGQGPDYEPWADWRNAEGPIRPTRDVRDTWLSQLWREISGGFAAKLALGSRAASRGNRPRPYSLKSKRRGRSPASPPPRPLSPVPG
jgi:hypothetical protein